MAFSHGRSTYSKKLRACEEIPLIPYASVFSTEVANWVSPRIELPWLTGQTPRGHMDICLGGIDYKDGNPLHFALRKDTA